MSSPLPWAEVARSQPGKGATHFDHAEFAGECVEIGGSLLESVRRRRRSWRIRRWKA